MRNMTRKLMHNTLAAAGFAALFLVGACASNSSNTEPTDQVQQVTESSTVSPATGPAIVDSDGNVYSSSAAPGSGNASSVGTNTNVNNIQQPAQVEVAETTIETPVETTTTETTTEATPVTTTPTETTPTETTTTTVPMTSSTTAQETTTTQETTPTRERLRKD